MPVAVVLLAAVLTATAPMPARGARTSATTTAHVDVLVRAVAGAAGAAAAAVRAAGGVVTAPLPIIDGVAASVPAAGLARLAGAPGVVAVSPDAGVHLQADRATSGAAPVRSAVTTTTRAEDLWAGGVRGAGSTVAVVDTGVSPSDDLAGRLVPVVDALKGTTSPCLDLSGEGTCRDGYGHGTFMAGLIAGDGTASRGRWSGMAPQARVLSVKVAGADGSSDVSKVLAAIQWVVSYRGQYGIDVLNLSLGTDSTQPWDVDPLNYAVERAWDAGIVVVVAASNLGPGPSTITKPADDPWVLTVGAVDDHGTPGRGDDVVPDFSGRGPTRAGLAKPDVAAPGAHVVSLRAPGSAIDTAYPNPVDGAYRVGSGTSMAAAVTSGAAALLAQAHPDWSPDQIKGALVATAHPASPDRTATGAGTIDVAAAAAGDGPAWSSPERSERSSGLGSLDLSRGSVRVAVQTGLLGSLVGNLVQVVLSGLTTAQLLTWDPVGFSTGTWSVGTWRLTSSASARWYGTTWAPVTWSGNSWHGGWNGNSWHEADAEGATAPDGTRTDDRYGRPWQGAAWYGLWE